MKSYPTQVRKNGNNSGKSPQTRSRNYISVTSETVRWAYRLFLDREAENQRVVDEKVSRCTEVRELRSEIMHSPEFLSLKTNCRIPSMDGTELPMQINLQSGRKDIEKLLRHIRKTWEKFGVTQPLWSVLVCDRYRECKNGVQPEDFIQTGKRALEVLTSTLNRNSFARIFSGSCLEFGCGVGRVTQWLANVFQHVHACDVSVSHLKMAKMHLSRKAISNVSFIHSDSIKSLESLPKSDVIYSTLVLQHNPPPLMAFILEQCLGALKPGGVAVVQLPTYRSGYSFCPTVYLQNLVPNQMEMHVLPQSVVFKIAARQGVDTLEVLEDASTGFRYGEVSNTFVFHRRTA